MAYSPRNACSEVSQSYQHHWKVEFWCFKILICSFISEGEDLGRPIGKNPAILQNQGQVFQIHSEKLVMDDLALLGPITYCHTASGAKATGPYISTKQKKSGREGGRGGGAQGGGSEWEGKGIVIFCPHLPSVMCSCLLHFILNFTCCTSNFTDRAVLQ